jgi:hypothetical protein
MLNSRWGALLPPRCAEWVVGTAEHRGQSVNERKLSTCSLRVFRPLPDCESWPCKFISPDHLPSAFPLVIFIFYCNNLLFLQIISVPTDLRGTNQRPPATSELSFCISNRKLSFNFDPVHLFINSFSVSPSGVSARLTGVSAASSEAQAALLSDRSSKSFLHAL